MSFNCSKKQILVFRAGTGLKISKSKANLENWYKLIINDDFSDVYFTSEQNQDLY